MFNLLKSAPTNRIYFVGAVGAAIAALTAWKCTKLFPSMLMTSLIHKMDKKFPQRNRIYHVTQLYDASMRDIVKPCPDLLYSCVILDFSKVDMTVFTIKRCSDNTYRSLSFFDNDTNVIKVFNQRHMKRQDIYRVVIVSPRYDIDKVTTGDIIVQCPTMLGIGLQRILCPSKNPLEMSSLITVQKQISCFTITVKPPVCNYAANKPDCLQKTRTFLQSSCMVGAGMMACMMTSMMACMMALGGTTTNFNFTDNIIQNCRKIFQTSYNTTLETVDINDKFIKQFYQWGVLSIITGISGIVIGVGMSSVGIICIGNVNCTDNGATRFIRNLFGLNVQSYQIGSWSYNATVGGKDCNGLVRSYIAMTSILALTHKEAIYMSATCDSDGGVLDSQRCYKIHCPPTMPASWWSITTYGPDNYLIPNSCGIYSCNQQMSVKNPDGSIDIIWSPTPKGTNWLPSGNTKNAQLILRLYEPRIQKLNGGTVTLPTIKLI